MSRLCPGREPAPCDHVPPTPWAAGLRFPRCWRAGVGALTVIWTEMLSPWARKGYERFLCYAGAMPNEAPFPPLIDLDPPSGDHYREMATKLRDLARQASFAATRAPLMKLAMSFDQKAARMAGRTRRPR